MGPGRSTDQVKPADKTCVVCGRRVEWRKKWERDWESVRYCSKACRTRKVRTVDEQLERAILNLIGGRSGSISPSDAVRALDAEGRRDLIEETRMAARRLAAAGKVEIIQHGRVVDPSSARGPIRIRLAAPGR